MKEITFPGTEEKVSEFCLGTMMFGGRCDASEADRIINIALERDINFIDTAPMYCEGYTEEILGKIIKGKRSKFFIATKFHKGLDSNNITESLNESLKRLQTDYVDLFLVHWPKVGMNPLEIMQTLNHIVLEGKARYIGCCNFPAWLFAHLNAIADRNGFAKFINNQVVYNIIQRGIEIEILPQAIAENIAITTYGPLAMGVLSGKYRLGSPVPVDSRGSSSAPIITWLSQFSESIERFIQLAGEKNIHPVQLAIAWVRSSKAVFSPIVGVSSLSQLETSINAFDYNMSLEEQKTISNIFNTEVKEEGLQFFPGIKYNFPRLRRNLDLLADN